MLPKRFQDTVGSPHRAQYCLIRAIRGIRAIRAIRGIRAIRAIRVVPAIRAYPLAEAKQAVPRRAIRGDIISVNSTLPHILECNITSHSII